MKFPSVNEKRKSFNDFVGAELHDAKITHIQIIKQF